MKYVFIKILSQLVIISSQQALKVNKVMQVDVKRQMPIVQLPTMPGRHFYRNWKPCVSALSMAFLSVSAIAAPVSQAPLFLTNTVPPNVMLLLDTSRSMQSNEVTPEATTFDNTQDYYGASVGGCDSSKSKGMSTTPTYTKTKPSESDKQSFIATSGGTKCFDPNKAYYPSKTDNAMDALVAAAFPVSTQRTTANVANFLNWYYRDQIRIAAGTKKRSVIAKAAAASFVDSLTDKVRFGFSVFDPFVDNDSEGVKIIEGVGPVTSTKKTNVTTFINNLDPNSTSTANFGAGTPLAESMSGIGRYFTQGGTTGKVIIRPGEKDPGGNSLEDEESVNSILDDDLLNYNNPGSGGLKSTSSDIPITKRCQKSYTVVLTDGLPSWDRDVDDDLKDFDGDCATGSLCTVYDMKKAYPYPGGNGGTGGDYKEVANAGSNSSDYFDDVTLALNVMDLRPDLRVASESDTAKNNMTTFVVGFADDAINPDIPGVNPLPKNAAIKGDGEFLFAGDEADLNEKLTRTFQSITEDVSAASSVAANSTQYQTNALLFQAIFNSADWSGDINVINLTSEDINGNGRLDKTTDSPAIVSVDEDTNGNGIIDSGLIGATRYFIGSRIPSAADRKIFSYNPTATTAKGINFFWNEFNDNQKSILDDATFSDGKTGKMTAQLSITCAVTKTMKGKMSPNFENVQLFWAIL